MKIESKMLAVFLVIALFITISLYFFEISMLNESIRQDMLNKHNLVNLTFTSLVEGDTRVLLSSMEVFKNLKDIKEVYLEKDREKLYNYAQPLFLDLKAKFRITHVYFILPSGNVFVRLHDKNIYGDAVERATFIRARDTNSTSTGIELGKTAYALRAVTPFYDNNDLIGYLEFGEEIGHFLNELKSKTGGEFAIIADKKFLNREDWKSVRQTAGLRDNWDDSKEHLIIDYTNEGVEKCFTEDNLEQIEKGETLLKKVYINATVLMCSGITIINPNGQHTGALLYSIDITSHESEIVRLRNRIFFVSLLIFAIAVGVSVIISESLARPIRKLICASREISGGNLGTKIDIKSNDETGELANTLRLMVANLKKSKEELEKYSKELEKKVEARTRDLRQKNVDLERFNKMVIGRELRMVGLKKRVAELEEKLQKK